jgi:hypothetical protein
MFELQKKIKILSGIHRKILLAMHSHRTIYLPRLEDTACRLQYEGSTSAAGGQLQRVPTKRQKLSDSGHQSGPSVGTIFNFLSFYLGLELFFL